MKQETNENKQLNQEQNKEKNDPIPDWLHERAEALAKGTFRNDRDSMDNG
ncbi:MAG: hypothetical protein OXH47_07355 [Paracoccaceae bacterium]|nr:hypothetical protein [Paracoccaceae bacterium]